jgi:hypothetical protein
MNNTNISFPIYFSDTPEVTGLNVKFFYNFYERDEGAPPGLNSTYSIFEGIGDFTPEKKKNVPRFVQISWGEYVNNIPEEFRGVAFRRVFGKNIVSSQKIIEEGVVPRSNLLSVNFLKTSSQNKIANLVATLEADDPNFQNIKDVSLESDIFSADINNISTDQKTDIAPLFNSSTGLNFILSNSVFSNLVNETKGDVFSQFFGESARTFSSIPEQENTNPAPFLIEKSVGYSQDYYNPEFSGFLITKFSSDSSGNLTKISDFVVGRDKKEFFDERVFYGSTYSYEIRAIWLFHVYINGRYYQIFFSSKPTISFVKCEERVAPPPPCEIKFGWDYGREVLKIFWNLPFNPQQDIKRVQIFRRKSIEHPFEIIGEYRFNDNIGPLILSSVLDNVPQDVVQVQENPMFPQKSFEDLDFNKNSRYIYSFASIDAHGISSSLSSQFEVYFNKSKNKLEKRLVSRSGAPKPYPNFYIEDENLFESSLVRSGTKFRKIHAIFNPDLINLKRSVTSQDVPIYTVKGKSYKFQIINLDNQKGDILHIEINNDN